MRTNLFFIKKIFYFFVLFLFYFFVALWTFFEMTNND